MTDSMHAIRFPGESTDYRAARDELLRAELALRRETERVAAMRRRLPPGGPIAEDYRFETVTDDISRSVRFSELFRAGLGTLVVYSFMYGPEMRQACSSCTSILDGLDGAAPHLLQRINLAVVAKSPPARLREFQRERGWRHLPLLSSAGSSYNSDYQGETADGAQMPILNVFTKSPEGIRHRYATELLFAPSDAGQDGRHVDPIWPIWNMLDYTPEGRGTGSFPKLRYGAT